MSINKLFDNTDRPLIITIVGWWLIVTAITTAYSIYYISSYDEVPVWGDTSVGAVWIIIFNVINGIVYLASGYGILNGKSWGRTVYLIYTPLSILVSAIAFQNEQSIIIIGLLYFSLIAFFLIRKDSNDFLNGNYEQSTRDVEKRKRIKKLRQVQQRKSYIARLFGVLFAVGSGWLVFLTVIIIAFSPEYNISFILLILSIPTIFGLLISCGLWGWKRWSAITGWSLASAGGITVFTGLTVALLSQTTAWQQSMVELGSEIDSVPFQLMWQIGLVPTVLGIVFLYLQHNRDIDLSLKLANNSISKAVNDSNIENRLGP